MLVTRLMSAKRDANLSVIFGIALRCACLFRVRSWLNSRLDTK
jgi:hypothetical protein